MIVQIKFLKCVFRGHWVLIVVHPSATEGPRIYYLDPIETAYPENRPDMQFIFNK